MNRSRACRAASCCARRSAPPSACGCSKSPPGRIGFLWPNLARRHSAARSRSGRSRRSSRRTRAADRPGLPGLLPGCAGVHHPRSTRRARSSSPGEDKTGDGHRPQRPGAVPALPAPRLQAEPVPEELLVRVPVPRLALRPARDQGRSAPQYGPAPRGMDRFSITVEGGRRSDRRHRQDHPRAAARRARPARPHPAEVAHRLHLTDRRRASSGRDPSDRSDRRARRRPPEPERAAARRRPPSEPPRSTASPRRQRPSAGLTPERAAEIVRQSSSARWVGFLAVLVVVAVRDRLLLLRARRARHRRHQPAARGGQAQPVTAVERGYNLFEANCARCHGANGEGGIGPVLNDQMKLFDPPQRAVHPQRADGRRPVRLRQPEQPDAGLGRHQRRAAQLHPDRRPHRVHPRPERKTTSVRDPAHERAGHERPARSRRSPAGATRTTSRARDATPVPACWSRRRTPAPSRLAAPGASGSAAPGASGSARRRRSVGRDRWGRARPEGRERRTSIPTPRGAGRPGRSRSPSTTRTRAIPHNIQIADGTGKSVFKGDTINGPNQSPTTSRRSRPAPTSSAASGIRT